MSTNDENSRDSQTEPSAQQSRVTRSRQPKDYGEEDLIEEYNAANAVTAVDSARAPLSSFKFSEAKIIVGGAYQADVPLKCNDKAMVVAEDDRASCMWHPDFDRVNRADISDYVKRATSKHGFTIEQALGLLHFNEYSIGRAIEQMTAYETTTTAWTTAEKATYEQLFDFHGKNFNRIHQMMPEKSMRELVEHYYNTKKTRNRLSYVEKERVESANSKQPVDSRRQLIELYMQKWKTSSAGDTTKADDSKPVDRLSRLRRLVGSEGVVCANCHRKCGHANEASVAGERQLLCNACYLYYRRTESPRPRDADDAESNDDDPAYKPKRANISDHHRVNVGNFTDYASLASTAGGKEDGAVSGRPLLAGDEQAGKATEQRIQGKKQTMEPMMVNTMSVSQAVAKARPLKYAITNTWTQADRVMAVKCFRRCGRDTQTIADLMGSKSKQQIDAFYDVYRSTYHLDKLIAQHAHDMSAIERDMDADAVNKWGEQKVEHVVELVDDDEPMDDGGDVIALS